MWNNLCFLYQICIFSNNNAPINVKPAGGGGGGGGGGQGIGWGFDCLCCPWGRAFDLSCSPGGGDI